MSRKSLKDDNVFLGLATVMVFGAWLTWAVRHPVLAFGEIKKVFEQRRQARALKKALRQRGE